MANRTDTHVRRVSGIVLGVFAALVAFTSAAAASTPQTEGAVRADHDSVVALTAFTAPSHTTPMLTPTGGDNEGSDYLPVNRWLGATGSFHSRLDTSIFNPGAILEATNRNVVATMFLSTGNAMWSTATWTVESATRFDIVDSALGGIVDNAAGSLGRTIMANPAIWTALIVVLAVTMLWKMSNSRVSGASAAKELLRGLATIGIMVVMVSGAMATTYNTRTDTVTYGKFSPGWIVSSLNTAISSVAGTLTVGVIDSIDTPAAELGRKDAYSCDAYVRALEDWYKSSAASNTEASTALTMNGMWKLTGLEAWTTAQFGPTRDGHSVYCRLLETKAGVTPGEQVRVMGQACVLVQGRSSQLNCTTNTAAAQTSLALASAGVDDGSTEAIDIAMVGWAACQPSRAPMGSTDGWKVRTGWSGFREDRQGEINKACNAWWSGGSGAVDGTGVGIGPVTITFNKSEVDFLNVGPNAGDVTEAVPGSSAADAEVRQYLWSLHGNSAAGNSGSAAAYTYVIASLTNLIAFGLASALIFVAKIMSVMFMLMLFVVLLFSLIPGGADDRVVAKFFRQFLGMTFIAFGYSLVLSMMVLVSSIIVRVVAAQFGAGTLPTMIFSGFAPLIAWFSIAYIFKNVLKAPNPMSIKGGLMYAGAAGAVGGAAAGAVSKMGRSATDGAASAVKSKAMGLGGGGGSGGVHGTGGGGGTKTGGMAKAMGVTVPEDSTAAEMLAAKDHDNSLKAKEAAGLEEGAQAADKAAVAARVEARDGKTSVLAAQGDKVAGAWAAMKHRRESGQPVHTSAAARVLARPAVALAAATQKPRQHITNLARAASVGDFTTMRSVASAAMTDGARGAGQVGARAVSATAKGLDFAAKHPLKAAGRVTAGAATVALAATPGGLPLAAGAVAAGKVIHDRRKASAPMSEPESQRILGQYREHEAADAAKREAAQNTARPEPLPPPVAGSSAPTSLSPDIANALAGMSGNNKPPPAEPGHVVRNPE